jgi:hypothetical protein
MKKITYFLALLLVFGCSTTDRLIEEQNYAEAADQLIGSLKKSPADNENIAKLDYVLIKSNSNKMARIEELKMSGQPDIWDEVLAIYQKSDDFQQKIKTLADTTLSLMKYEFRDYSGFITQARNKATEYHYALAKKLLEKEDIAAKQQAFKSLKRANRLTPGYKDAEQLIAQFEAIEPVFIYYHVRNNFSGFLPHELRQELKYLDLSQLSTYQYRFKQKSGEENFDFAITIDILDVKISPENTEELYYVETAKVQDGIGYKLDDEGDFVYDSLGKKIEYPLLKTIACYVTETVKEKAMLIGGRVEITDLAKDRVIAGQYITGETKFKHRFAKFKGDLNALSPETMELLGTKDMEYPSDIAMILRAGDKFKYNAVDFILAEMKKIDQELSKK